MQYIQSHLRVVSRTSFCLVSHQGFYNPWIDKTLVYNETITKHRVLGFLCLKTVSLLNQSVQYENKRTHRQRKKLLIVKQILLSSAIERLE